MSTKKQRRGKKSRKTRVGAERERRRRAELRKQDAEDRKVELMRSFLKEVVEVDDTELVLRSPKNRQLLELLVKATVEVTQAEDDAPELRDLIALGVERLRQGGE